MRFETTLILFLISLFLLAVVHAAAMSFGLYYHYPWFDIPMHFWGGTLIGMGSMTALFAKIFRFSPSHVSVVLVLTFLVGGAWEIFEWYAGIAGVVTYLITIIPDYQTLWIIDTVKDLVLDLLGGALGYMLAIRFRDTLDPPDYA